MDSLQNFSLFVNDTYMQGVLIHEIFACMFFLPYLWYLYVFYTSKTYLQMNHKIFFIMPITIFLLSVALATGVFLFAMRNFIPNNRIICMIMVFFIFLFGEIYRLVALKRAKTSRKSMQKYVKTFKIMYSLFLVLYCSLIIFCKV